MIVREGFGAATRARSETTEEQARVELSPPRGLAVYVFRVGSEEYALLSHDAPTCAPGHAVTKVLSPAEHQVIEALLVGASATTIARSRGVSPLTVRNQIRSAYAKLGVSNRAELGRRIAADGGSRAATGKAKR